MNHGISNDGFSYVAWFTKYTALKMTYWCGILPVTLSMIHYHNDHRNFPNLTWHVTWKFDYVDPRAKLLHRKFLSQPTLWKYFLLAPDLYEYMLKFQLCWFEYFFSKTFFFYLVTYYGYFTSGWMMSYNGFRWLTALVLVCIAPLISRRRILTLQVPVPWIRHRT